MDVKEAAKAAIVYVADLFAAENITDLGLEEIEFDEAYQEWIVTVGFSRPWDYPSRAGALAAINPALPNRTYKVLRIDNDGQVQSVKNRKS